MTTATITPPEAGATSLSSSAITISDLTVRFSSKRADVTALDDIDLQVVDGEFVSIAGPSGCGSRRC